MSLYYCWFEHRFLRAGLLAEGDRLVLIDILHDRGEFSAMAASGKGAVGDEGPFAALIGELEEYLDGVRRTFTLRPAPPMGGFAGAVLEAAANVPYGRVATYAETARAAGSPRAARAAGNALARNPFPILIPCHRVVRSGGRLGGFGGGGFPGGIDLKRKLLSLEGLSFEGDRISPPA